MTAIVGCVLLAPGTATAAMTTVAAETLSLPPSAGRASGGELLMWSNATATGRVTLHAARRITVRARATSAQGRRGWSSRSTAARC